MRTSLSKVEGDLERCSKHDFYVCSDAYSLENLVNEGTTSAQWPHCQCRLTFPSIQRRPPSCVAQATCLPGKLIYQRCRILLNNQPQRCRLFHMEPGGGIRLISVIDSTIECLLWSACVVIKDIRPLRRPDLLFAFFASRDTVRLEIPVAHFHLLPFP